MQSIGLLIFLLVIGMAFWVLIFLGAFVPYMITLFMVEKFNPELANTLAFWCDEEEC